MPFLAGIQSTVSHAALSYIQNILLTAPLHYTSVSQRIFCLCINTCLIPRRFHLFSSLGKPWVLLKRMFKTMAQPSLWLWKAMAFLNHSYTCVLQSAATDEAAMFWGAFRLVWSAVRFVCFVLFLASSSDSASPYVCWGGFQLR